METKKLTVEVDADASKAKRKLQGLADVAGGSGGGAGDNASRAVSGAAERAAKSLGKLDESAGGLDRRMVGVTQAFAGIAVGMATSYASRYFAEGSTAQTLMDYVGGVTTGASTGAAAGAKVGGPKGAIIGAVVGGVAGAGKTFMDKSSENETRLAEFDKSERIYEGIRAWQKKLLELTESLDSDEIAKILSNLRNTEQLYKSHAREATAGGRYQEAADWQRNLGDVRQRQQQLEALQRQIEKKAVEPRTKIEALDSLARVGGNFAGGEQGFRDLQRVNEKQVAILEKIEAKTGKGAGRF